MTIKKQVANKVLKNLDETANKIDQLAKAGQMDPRLAAALTRDIDSFADKFQVEAFGPESLQRHSAKVAKVLQKDSDEKFMDTFENPNKVLQSDSDEPYMHKTEPSFNAKGIDNFDQDMTTMVTERDEYAVRDLSEHAESTKKQPSWSKGPAGKSTKQGAVAPRTASGKTWSR